MLFDWVIFDAMGVVFEVGDDVNDLLVPFLRERDASIESDGVNRLYRYASLGEISSHGFWNELGFGDAYPGIEREYLGSRLRLDGEFANVAQSLRQEHSLAMLSNDIAEWSRFLRQDWRISRDVLLKLPPDTSPEPIDINVRCFRLSMVTVGVGVFRCPCCQNPMVRK